MKLQADLTPILHSNKSRITIKVVFYIPKLFCYIILVKGKVVAMLNILRTEPWRRMGEWMYRSTFLDLGTSWRWVAGFTPLPIYIQGKSPPDTHWIGGWVEPRAGLGDVEMRKLSTLPGLELRPLGRPARSQSPYQNLLTCLLAWCLSELTQFSQQNLHICSTYSQYWENYWVVCLIFKQYFVYCVHTALFMYSDFPIHTKTGTSS
jgi:hypothetical protein